MYTFLGLVVVKLLLSLFPGLKGFMGNGQLATLSNFVDVKGEDQDNRTFKKSFIKSLFVQV